MAAPFSPIKIHFLAITRYPAGTALHDGIIFASSQKIALVIGIESAKKGTRINEGLLECSARNDMPAKLKQTIKPAVSADPSDGLIWSIENPAFSSSTLSPCEVKRVKSNGSSCRG